MRKKAGPSTRSVHLCRQVDSVTGALIPPVFSNASFAYPDVETWRAVALGKKDGDIYSRNTNPTTTRFEQKMAALEGAEAATSFTTGMAAINGILFALLRPGMHAVSVKDAYGATYLHFSEILPEFGIDCTICETHDHRGILQAVSEGCDLLYLETPTNPTLKILDIKHLSDAAHKAGATVVVDNTFATPINQLPLTLGADVVVHSATKYINGHGDVLGGVACGSSELIEKIFHYRELAGPAMDAHVAYLMLRSLKTLGLRIQRQNENALELARFLQDLPGVSAVFYPGLESHPGYHVAKQQMTGFGGVLSFELEGGFEMVKKFLPRLNYAYMAANLGQVETVVGPPATTSHVELTDREREVAGIPEGLIRYAAGIEDVDDLKEDIASALKGL